MKNKCVPFSLFYKRGRITRPNAEVAGRVASTAPQRDCCSKPSPRLSPTRSYSIASTTSSVDKTALAI